MGERNNPDRGETTLAAATAAIITARWQQLSGPAGDPMANGHAPANGHGPTGGTAEVSSPWAPPVAAPDAALPPVSPAPFAPTSPAPFAPVSPAPFAPVSPASAPPVSPAPAPPVSPAGPGHGSQLGAAAAFFRAVDPDPVPEVFDARVPAPREHGLPRRDPYASQDLSAPLEEVRTQIPPGFERRDFGPFPDELPPTPLDTGRGTPPPRGDSPDDSASHEPPASALLGTLPPPAWAEPAMASSLAPPEPAPWVDTGWTDFGDLTSRTFQPDGGVEDGPAFAGGEPMSSQNGGDPEPVEARAGVATGDRQPLPRRVPRVPDMDFPLFASDPAEPAPDPATERHELNRIADYLRDEAEAPEPAERPDGVDLGAVLAAVRQVPEVRDAQLRWNAQAGHTLRIEFVDGVDESEITKSVVRLLRSKLGLGAQPSTEEPTVDTPFRGRVAVGAARVPTRHAAPTGRGRALPRPSGVDVARLVVENVTVTRLGAEATVEVRLRGPGGTIAVGEGHGPGVDAYLSRLAATAAGHAVDQVLAPGNRGKVFIEHVSVVPFGVTEVAVVVLLFSYDGVAEQLSGSAIVGDDPHQAVVRATLAALNRRLEALL